MAFGGALAHWDEDLWRRVIFSDESSLTLGMGGANNRIYVRRPVGDFNAYHSDYLWRDFGRVRSGKIKFWAGFTATAKAPLYFYNGTITAAVVNDICRTTLLPFALEQFPVGSGAWHVLHDNDKRWRANAAITWRHNHGVDELPIRWPSYSPDLNPIENLFALLAQRVWDRNPEGVDELCEFLEQEWNAIEQHELAELAYSMMARCTAVVESGGHKIPY